MCNRKCRCSKRTRSPYLKVYQSCYFCHYQRKWASQPKGRIMNIYKKAHNLPKSKHKPHDKLSVNTKAQWCQLNKASISESSVSKPDGISEDPQYQLWLRYDWLNMNLNFGTNPVQMCLKVNHYYAVRDAWYTKYCQVFCRVIASVQSNNI